jgi:hypothetical protein
VLSTGRQDVGLNKGDGMLFAILALDLYIVVYILDWALNVTDLQVDPRFRGTIAALAAPYVDWVSHVLRPGWRGHDLSRITGVVLLVSGRCLVSLAT